MEKKLAASFSEVQFDTDLYGASDTTGYLPEIPVNEEDEIDAVESEVGRRMASYTAPKSLLSAMPRGSEEENDNDLGFWKPQAIAEREDDYRKRRLNRVWPNIFETSPHVINPVVEAIEGMRVVLGAALILNYCLQGLLHPARKVREVYWNIYNSLYIGAQVHLWLHTPPLKTSRIASRVAQNWQCLYDD